jgi:LmbE family N-acetylglucosaminyl deacetylase
VIDAQKLVTLREAEAVAACACLGLAASEVRFLHFRDGGLTDCVDQLAACLDAEVAAFAPEQILYPCGIDLHPDHRAVATAVERLLKAAGQAPPAYAYPVWFWKLRPWISRPGFLAQLPRLRPVKVSAGEFIGRKRAAIDEHRSQVKSLTAEDGRQVLNSAFTGHFLDAYELFFEFVPAPSWRPTGR